MIYDILILTTVKDYNKLPFLIQSIEKNLQDWDHIYVISPTHISNNIPNTKKDIIFHTDEEVIDFDFSKLKGNAGNGRTGWYKQQFIKLFQQVTLNNYLVIDSDVYINRPIKIFENNKPNFLLGKDQCHEPYFQFMKLMFGFGQEYHFSFINEMMLFKRNYIDLMLAKKGMTRFEFLYEAVNIINEINHVTSSFSEYEMYGNFITKYFPDLYNYKHLETMSLAKHRPWTDEEIKQVINYYDKENIDKISMHSWMKSN